MNIPRHVAIIMDGNGRWAARRGWSRIKGHKEGVARVEEVLETAGDAGIAHLSLYAFSTENWCRPPQEVVALMVMFRLYLRVFRGKFLRSNVRFHHLGSPEGLPTGLLQDLRALEEATAGCTGMVFHLAVNYGSRLELVHALRRAVADGLAPEDLTEQAISDRLWTAGVPDVDLMIRTSGEQRISNFLLWQAAYAEFYVTDCLWPDFHAPQLLEALAAYGQRDRRFGGTEVHA